MDDLLSSEILEKQFGPTELNILYQDGAARIITTSAKSNGQVLEISRAQFIPAGISKFPNVHQAVLAGTSMGTAFRSAGITFVRQQQAAYKYDLSANFEYLFGEDGPATIVIVSILVGPEQTPYAEILETYSPVVQWPNLQGVPTDEQLDSIKSLNGFLAEI
ncbi:MAG TPA: hypothetical protein VFC50_03470 [Candidatus Dormibacteraeota bacterium]|nr:hypothetical protein [Candidatus Dormibacteraeota bacterium]